MSGAGPAPETSYRALLAVPWLSRILVAMIIARIAQSMVAIAIVLFTLEEYGSPVLTGIVTLAATLPGLLVSPIAGALLDRHGRMRLVRLDYLVAMLALALIALLSLLHALPAWLLVLITAFSSLTAILSVTGLRSLFPMIVPEHLWERVNAVDFERLRHRDDLRATAGGSPRHGPGRACRSPGHRRGVRSWLPWRWSGSRIRHRSWTRRAGS